MRIFVTVALVALGALSFAQIKFDELTKKNMSPQWGTVLVGSQAYFNDPCQMVINNYHDWQQIWPYIAGPYYQRGMQVPPFVDWNNEQIVFISLGNLGAQGYGIYVENVQRISSFQFDINYVITRPNIQVGVNYSSFSFGMGTTPYVALRVPRNYGIPNFYSRYYQPPSYVVRSGCGCGNCRSHNNQVWMVGAGGVLLPYTPPGQQQGGK
jgi:hypothetical protein